MNASQSPQPSSQSPTTRPSAFEWPVPPHDNDISVREIIEKYYPNDQELLKHVLMAKAEEDRKQTAQDVLKTERARIHLRQLDLEIIKEQSRANHHPIHALPPPPPPPPTYGYYSLAPIQQQVLARITGSSEHPQHNNHNTQKDYQAPTSPVVYPHSAHPLCPPDNRLNPPRQYLLQLPPSQQLTTPISPHEDSLRKRGRASIANINEEDKVMHNKVMEALKAKIQRGSSSPLATTAPNSAFRDTSTTATTTVNNTTTTTTTNNNKRQRTLPKPTIEPPQINTAQPSTPSPRSAKPILPPIDTNIGRIPTTKLPSHPLISPTSSSSHPSISSVCDTN
ncbi:unnamed protein product [Mucor hiemalis]